MGQLGFEVAIVARCLDVIARMTALENCSCITAAAKNELIYEKKERKEKKNKNESIFTA